jgi:MoxR-like ATPase
VPPDHPAELSPGLPAALGAGGVSGAGSAIGAAELPASVAATAALLAGHGYIADMELATTVHLALSMRRPLFLEGEPGTGKTEIAKVLAAGLRRRLVRLQCYDGMDLAAAAYEWDHPRQLMAIRLAEAAGQTDRDELARDIYTREFLQARPLLSAIDPDLPPAVLLIDELDRADEPFEAFLLELLADFQITVPELGTVRAKTLPVVVLTSNRTREVHDAIRRRCLYHWVDYPDTARERAILAVKAPGVPEALAAQVVAFVQRLRGEELFKLPGVTETIDWAAALTHLNAHELTPGVVDETLGVLLKYQDDIAKVRGAEAARLVSEVQAAA